MKQGFIWKVNDRIIDNAVEQVIRCIEDEDEECELTFAVTSNWINVWLYRIVER